MSLPATRCDDGHASGAGVCPVRGHGGAVRLHPPGHAVCGPHVLGRSETGGLWLLFYFEIILLGAQHIRTGLASLSSQTSFRK